MEKLSQEEFESIWGKKPILIIDTSSIFDLYRGAPSKSESALNLLKEISKEQLFIPAQVYQEYNKNKQFVIAKEFKKINNVKQDLENIVFNANNSFEKVLYEYKRRHYPNIKALEEDIKKLTTEIKKIATEYKDSNQDEIEKNKFMLQNDKIEPFINELKENGCIGAGFAISTLLDIYDEGEKRFKYQIPPGYKDLKKDQKDTTKREKFGDLIVWKETLEKAASIDNDVIYLTSDKKEWTSDKKGNKFPDRLLFEEFKDYSTQNLYFWELNDLVVMLSNYDQEDHLLRNMELNYNDILEFIFSTKGLFSILESDEFKLTNYLVHSGELQECVSNVLADVDISDYDSPEINDFSIEVFDRETVIDGNLNVLLSTTIYESYGDQYTHQSSAKIELSGNFSIKFDINSDEILKNETFEPSWIKLDSLHTESGGFEIISFEEKVNEDDDPFFFDRCIDCGKRNANYSTNAGDAVCEKCSSSYSSCPSCGRLFKEPFLNPVCADCGGSNVD
ncbi:hypothetical protein IQ283_08225 (plasmid) [Alkalihalobacillus hwajinpoensis]|uniref:PIN-like domain-containing protein n=1 Tax=Guptibacillus hwajinpoensis TaxID=208199 RepID=UPI0018840F67|nr:PIN-like domain-containing protein [Pseudalkalibacillus hwajinpoensis]MBF0706595.1 hypothetical protein [Pseudalkalibacillus hwajinpoensis]